MRRNKFILIVQVVFFCFVCTYAQQKSIGYKEATVSLQKKSNKALADKTTQKSDSVWNKEDSFLRVKQILLINDSAESFKNNKEFAYAKNLDSALKVLMEREARNNINEERTDSWLEKFFSASATKNFFWGVAIVFICFILYKLFFTEGIFQRLSIISNVTAIINDDEQLSATTDYDNLIVLAVANKNYRLATRYHYLQTLQKLAVKKAILFTPDKTNYQYISELNNKPYKNDFARLTLNYDYAWYGNFIISEKMFAAIQHNFMSFNNQL